MTKQEACERCNKEAQLIVFGRELICLNCLNEATSRVQPKKKSVEEMEDWLFDDQAPAKECNECGAKENLEIGHTDPDYGHATWICNSCKDKREAEIQERIDREQAYLARSERRDRWEEPHKGDAGMTELFD